MDVYRPPFDPRIATAADLEKLLGALNISRIQLVEIYLDQIEKYNGYLHAVISTAPKAALFDKAKQLDSERRAGKVRSALHGIPILVKDNIATHPDLGMETTAGSLALVGSRPKKSADAVDRLVEAGVIILGKANLSELSYFKGEDSICGWSAVGGQTQSAYARGGLLEDDTPGGHSNPGGSSSGPAVAVSAGLAPISLGTETAASLISPASKAALYTLKPTVGIVSQDGVVPISSFFDSPGPLTKNVKDLANIMDIIVDPTKTRIPQGGYVGVLSTSWENLKVGMLDPADWGSSDSWTKPDPGATKQIRQAYDDAYAKIKSQAKSTYKFVPLPTGQALQIHGDSAFRNLFTGYFKKEIESYLSGLEYAPITTLQGIVDFNREHADKELPPRYPLQDRLEKALNQSFTQEQLDESLAHARRVGRSEGIDKMLKDYDIDVIIGPAESAMPSLAAAAGYPIAGMPLGYLDFNGRPFGMAALASAHQDDVLIKLQSVWEATFPPRQPPPYATFSNAPTYVASFTQGSLRIPGL